jgi:hypothetical protein
MRILSVFFRDRLTPKRGVTPCVPVAVRSTVSTLWATAQATIANSYPNLMNGAAAGHRTTFGCLVGKNAARGI